MLQFCLQLRNMERVVVHKHRKSTFVHTEQRFRSRSLNMSDNWELLQFSSDIALLYQLLSTPCTSICIIHKHKYSHTCRTLYWRHKLLIHKYVIYLYRKHTRVVLDTWTYACVAYRERCSEDIGVVWHQWTIWYMQRIWLTEDQWVSFYAQINMPSTENSFLKIC